MRECRRASGGTCACACVCYLRPEAQPLKTGAEAGSFNYGTTVQKGEVRMCGACSPLLQPTYACPVCLDVRCMCYRCWVTVVMIVCLGSLQAP
jgi:hypothetical protein